MNKKCVLLINLGSPDRSDPASVYRYLTQFLNDPRVVDLSVLTRWLLVNCVIVPRRFRRTTKAYRTIWEGNHSPLMLNSLHLRNALSQGLGPDYQVELGMRYGKPSIEFALNQFQDCVDLRVVPLFPHYASAATGSALTEVMKQLAKKWNIPSLRFKKDFYCDPGFISSYAEVIKNNTIGKPVDLILFSYHGVPERHIKKSDCKAA
jgi:protoporphyrin/coproporphyrin ferrochelatase